MSRRKRSPEDVMLLAALLFALGFVVAAMVASAAVALLTAASETAEPPTVSIGLSPPDPTNQTVGTFTFASSRANATFECALDGSDFAPCISPHDVSGLAAGERNFRVRALDPATGRGPAARYTWRIDLTPPELTVSSDTVVEATGSAGAVVRFSAASAADASGIARGPTCSQESGSIFSLGSTVVTCTAADRAGNVAEARFTVTVRDTTPPVLSALPADTTVEATGPDGAVVLWTLPTASDLVSGAVAARCAPEPGATLPLGASTVVCTATDDAGNSVEGGFSVTVSDTRPPTVSVPAAMEAAATSRQGAEVGFMVTANDVVGVASGPTCEPRSGEVFPLGSTVVTCSASDAAGNIGTASFVVTVFDATPPVITVEVTGRLGNDGWYTSPVGLTWNVDDPESDVTSTSGCDDIAMTDDTAGITFTCRATSAGGTVSDSLTIRIDRTPPGPTVSAFVQQTGQYRLESSDAGSGVAAIYYQVVESGNQPSTTGWARYSSPFSCPAEGSYTIHAYAEDRAGNRENPRAVGTLACLF